MTKTDDIKAAFWNVGKNLTEKDDDGKINHKKVELLNETIKTVNPDIFCIAEGTFSKTDCKLLEKTFSDNGYITFYSPLFPEPKEMQEEADEELSYVSKRYRLKIFYKEGMSLRSEFSFTALRENGRIIVFKVYHKFKLLTFIFIHNKSKEGETEDTLDQTDNIKGIYELISLGKTVGEKERIIIMGDFNLNPWDRLLHHKTHLNTSFFQNKNSILQRFPEKCFFNPVVELLANSRKLNFAGTHFSTIKKKWGLFDYVLYDTKDVELNFEILTELPSGIELLNSSETVRGDYFNHHLDHFPIVTTITKLISDYEQFE